MERFTNTRDSKHPLFSAGVVLHRCGQGQDGAEEITKDMVDDMRRAQLSLCDV